MRIEKKILLLIKLKLKITTEVVISVDRIVKVAKTGSCTKSLFNFLKFIRVY